MKKTLLILAAGMGSRYGGLKQIDTIGPNNEILIEYSIYDAIKAGFNKIVFIIREDFSKEFMSIINSEISHQIEVHYIFQNNNDVPSAINSSIQRDKPLGTAHAIWCARNQITEPFVVINADDFYGRESYVKAIKFLSKPSKNFAVIAFKLGDTLSNYGGVNRGVCYFDKSKKFLRKIIETRNIKIYNQELVCDNPEINDLKMNSSVSMNMFCLKPIYFDFCEDLLVDYYSNEENKVSGELLIPDIIDFTIENSSISTEIIKVNASWFGVTYKADKIMAKYKIEDMIKHGLYPQNLFAHFAH